MSENERLALEAWNVWDLNRNMANEPNEITSAKITARVAVALAAAEERGRRSGVEAAKELAGAAECLLRFRDPWDSASRRDWQRYREALARIEDLELRVLAPRDSGTCGADEDGIHREARKDRK